MQVTSVQKIIDPGIAIVICLKVGKYIRKLENILSGFTITSDCASSLSWCGKARSIPPE
jgi:hypothetical protein